MQLFRGPWRKLTSLPLSTLVLGWLVYLVGFTLLTANTSGGARFEYIPYYIATAAPPLLVVMTVLHAGLFGVPSSILGGFTAVWSVICFFNVGYVLYSSALVLYRYLHFNDKDGKVDVKSILMFVGTLIETLSWTLVLMFWNYFTYKRPWRGDQGTDYVVDEDGTMDSPPPSPQQPPPFAGIARKLAALFLLLQAGSWCVLITGIDAQVHANSSAYHNPPEVGLYFSTWTTCVVGILLVISAAMHAGANREASALVGVLTSLLSSLYLICAGYLVAGLGISIHYRCENNGGDCSNNMFPRYEMFQICGGLGSCIFWALVLALWPFYYKPVENESEMRRSVVRRRRYYLQNQDRSERVPLLYQPAENPYQTVETHKPPTPTPIV